VIKKKNVCSDSGLMVFGEALKLKHRLVVGMGSAAVEAGLAAALSGVLFDACRASITTPTGAFESS
jgi:hypothetical protein